METTIRTALVRRSSPPPAPVEVVPFEAALRGVELASDLACFATVDAVRELFATARFVVSSAREVTNALLGVSAATVGDVAADAVAADVVAADAPPASGPFVRVAVPEEEPSFPSLDVTTPSQVAPTPSTEAHARRKHKKGRR